MLRWKRTFENPLLIDADAAAPAALAKGQMIAPFAPSDSNCLNFKLPVESNPQAQPLEDVFL